MSKITHRQHGIALLMALLLVGTTTFTGLGKSLNAIVATDAHISDVTLGTDKKMTEETDEFESDETIFAAVDIEDNDKTLRVKARLRIVDVPGQNPGLIKGIEAIVTIKGEATADFSFTNPTNGWPKGKYQFEALLIDGSGATIDTEEHVFMVH